MKRLYRAFAIGLLALLMMGNRGCQTPDSTVILPEGPKATALGVAKDNQIKGLLEQVKAEQEARELEQILARKAASNFLGVLKALDYMDPSPAREAASEESKLGKQRLGKDDPEETVKALQRVIDLVTGQRDKALQDYATAKGETERERALVTAKDAEIIKRDATIKTQGDNIVRLESEKTAEQEAHKADIKKTLDAKDAEFAAYKVEQASKERRWWVNASRIAGLGLIVIGAIVLAVFKLPGAGGGLIGAGVLIGLISMGIEALVNTWWFPWLCGIILVAVLGLGGYLLYRLWVKHQLDDKKTQAIQDMIDEANARGDLKAVEELKAHLSYRMGGKNSFWGRNQTAETVKLGLVDPKGEEALKPTPPPSS